MRSTYLLVILIVGFTAIHPLQAQESELVEVNYLDSISAYHELNGAGDYLGSAKMAFNIAESYAQIDSISFARKFYNYAFNDAGRARQRMLEARAIYKEGMMDKKLAESGRYGMEEEQEFYKSTIRKLKKAHGLFGKSNMDGSYEDVLTLISGGEAQFIIGDYKDAETALSHALKDAQKNRYDDLAFKSANLLAQCYAELGDSEREAHFKSISKNYQEFFISKDSLVQTVEKVEKLETTNEMQKTELELKKSEIENMNLKLESEIARQERNEAIIRQNQLERKVMIGGSGIIFIFLVIAIIANQYKKKTNRKLEKQNKQILEQKEMIEKRQKELKDEKSKTDALLLNILPAPIARELQTKKKVTPRFYKMVTVMFTDFKGFTSIASEMSPGEVVRELDICFAAFDQIIEKYEQSVGRKCVEKIKTIGDGYMCAGGVPIVNETNPQDIVKVALAFTQYMEKRKEEKIRKNEPYFEIRIGVNTGPVVAGVVGRKKFAYDIWGDAVNLASRLESSSEAGKVNISGQTYKYIRGQFFFTYRGKIRAKNKGEVDMYFVDGRVKYAGQPDNSERAAG
jgi:class 3 adenylate cyclase